MAGLYIVIYNVSICARVVDPLEIIDRSLVASSFMGSFRLLSSLTYLLLVLLTVCAILLSCVALLSQAVRTSPSRSWSRNINALIIGASYIVVVRPTTHYPLISQLLTQRGKFFTSLFFCAKRRIAVRLKLQRISKNYRPIGKGDVPNVCCVFDSCIAPPSSLMVC